MANIVRIKKEEAKRIFNYDMVNKDWWNVSHDYDNRLELQMVLDHIYNSEKNIFVAEYSESQAGLRLAVRCKICNKVLSSYDPLRSHSNGKMHKKNVCQATLNIKPNFAHLVFKKLNLKKDIFEENSLEWMVDCTSHPVLGIQFVYKELINKEAMFSCQLCMYKFKALKLRTKQMFDHLISDEHNFEYVDKIHHLNPKGIVDCLRTFSEIEEKEGKVCHKFATVLEYDDPSLLINNDEKLEVKHPTGVSVGVQCSNMTSIEDFVEEAEHHRIHMNMESDIPKMLANDVKAQELLIKAASVLTEKINTFATVGDDQELVNYTRKLAEHCRNLSPYSN